MTLFLIAVVAVVALVFQPLRDAFLANAPLNGLIVGVLVLGVFYNFRQVWMLNPEVTWIESFRSEGAVLLDINIAPPKLLAPMATMLGKRNDRLSLSTLAMRSLLDGIASRLDESRDLSRYTIGLLIFQQPGCNHRPEVVGGLRERDCAALLKGFFRARR